MQVLDDLGRHREAAAVGMELLAALEAVPPAPGDDPELRRWLSAANWDNRLAGGGVAFWAVDVLASLRPFCLVRC